MATTVYMERDGSRLVPTAEWCEQVLRDLPAGVEFRVDIVRERSLPQHKLYWGLCRKVADMLNAMGDEGATKDTVSDAIKVHLGLYRLHPLSLRQQRATGQRYGVIVGSIAFDKLEQDDFNRFMDRVTAFVLSEILPHVPTREFRREIEKMLIKDKEAKAA